MVDIKCKGLVSSKSIKERIRDRVSQVRLTSPNGELDQAMYRSIDGTNLALVLWGFDNTNALSDPETVLQETIQKDYIEIAEPANPEAVYATKGTAISHTAQAIYNNPIYAKCVRSQVENQLCSPEVFNLERFPLNLFSTFAYSRISPQSITNIQLKEKEILTEIRRDILTRSRTPSEAILGRPEVTGFASVPIPEDTFNANFYATVITQEEIQRTNQCKVFRDNGVIPNGTLLNLDLTGCNTTGRLEELPPPRGAFGNLLDSISSIPQAYSSQQQEQNLQQQSPILQKYQVFDNIADSAIVKKVKLALDVLTTDLNY
ncbi:MAG: hypothetical protein ACRC80_29730, partial [Waterburya sp.]